MAQVGKFNIKTARKCYYVDSEIKVSVRTIVILSLIRIIYYSNAMTRSLKLNA